MRLRAAERQMAKAIVYWSMRHFSRSETTIAACPVFNDEHRIVIRSRSSCGGFTRIPNTITLTVRTMFITAKHERVNLFTARQLAWVSRAMAQMAHSASR